MKRMNKKYLAVLLAACVALAGWHVDVKNANAATFSDINQDSVFLSLSLRPMPQNASYPL